MPGAGIEPAHAVPPFEVNGTRDFKSLAALRTDYSLKTVWTRCGQNR